MEHLDAYALAAQVCDMNHVLCVQHFRTGIVAGRAGMPIELADSYMRECNDLLFRRYTDEATFESKVKELLATYQPYNNAVKVLQKISNDSKRVCATMTSQLFTAGHVSFQRAESMNARIKKDDLRKSNPLDIVKAFDLDL